MTGCPRRSAKLGSTAGAPLWRYASSRRSIVVTRTWGRSTGQASSAAGRTGFNAASAARSEPIGPPATSRFSTIRHSCAARAGRMRGASGPSTTTRGFRSSASSASRMRMTNGRPRKSRSALGAPMRSERPAASTTPATDMGLRYRELRPGAKPPNWRPMAVRRIRLLGDPILRKRCERVQDPKSAATRLVADDLRDTLRAAKEKYKMGRALAAPQIGAPVRIVFVQIDKQRWTMINPEITDVGPAELLHHEIDHLDGILALDRASGLDPFALRSEWEKLYDRSARHGPPQPREV